MSGVIISVESYQVRLQDRSKHFLSDWQGPIDFGRRKGRVQEPPDLHSAINPKLQTSPDLNSQMEDDRHQGRSQEKHG